MARIIKMGFTIDIDGKAKFFVIRDDNYFELQDENIDDVEQAYQALREKANKVKTDEQIELERVEKEKASMVQVIVEKTTDEQKLDLIEVFPEWDSNSVEYKVGDYISYEGKLYRVLQNHTSQSGWTPEFAASLFTQINKKGEIPEFGKLTDGSDRNLTTNPYELGDQCIWEGYVWEWILDNPKGVWSPTDYPQGWEKIRPV